jgi:hypothetical protein
MSQLIKPGTHPTITELYIKRIPVFECEAVIDYVVRFLLLKISKKHQLGPFELSIMRNPRDDVDTTRWVIFKNNHDHEVILRLPPQEREIEYAYKGKLLIRTLVFRINRLGSDLVVQTPKNTSPYPRVAIKPSCFEATIHQWPQHNTIFLVGHTIEDLLDMELELTRVCSTTYTSDIISEPTISTPCAWYDVDENRYKRAIVTKLTTAMDVLLELVDYGREFPATSLELRRIPDRFMEMPIETMTAKLYGLELGPKCPNKDGKAIARKRGRVSGKIVEIVNGVPYVVIKYNNKCLNVQLAGTRDVDIDTNKFSAMVEVVDSLPPSTFVTEMDRVEKEEMLSGFCL